MPSGVTSSPASAGSGATTASRTTARSRTSSGAELHPPRILPALDDVDRPFWTGGHLGQLLIERCSTCDRWQHPPTGRCAACGGSVEPSPVSGRGAVFTCTVDHHQFHPEVPPPYVIALVELAEQANLRVVANVVGCDPDEVAIGMPVEVDFEVHGEHAVPVFRPVTL